MTRSVWVVTSVRWYGPEKETKLEAAFATEQSARSFANRLDDMLDREDGLDASVVRVEEMEVRP